MQQVDDYVVKPADVPTLVRTIESKLAKPASRASSATTQTRLDDSAKNAERIQELWTSFIAEDQALARLPISSQQRLEFLQKALQAVMSRRPVLLWRNRQQNLCRNRAVAPNKLTQYTTAMKLQEFCLLRKVLAQIVQENLLAVNLSYVVPDLAIVNESLDEQAEAAVVMMSA